MEKDKVVFGLKEILRNSKKAKSKKARIFVVSDARESTLDALDAGKVEFEKIKNRTDVAKELGLDFECEVFSIK